MERKNIIIFALAMMIISKFDILSIDNETGNNILRKTLAAIGENVQ